MVKHQGQDGQGGLGGDRGDGGLGGLGGLVGDGGHGGLSKQGGDGGNSLRVSLLTPPQVFKYNFTLRLSLNVLKWNC